MKIVNYQLIALMSLVAIIFVGCDNKSKLLAKKLEDTIEIIRKKTDFRPLSQNEAYSFLNKYYLPELDKSSIKRKINIYPLSGTDFKKRFEQVSSMIKNEFEGDTLPPPLEVHNILLNKSFKWDSRRLVNTIVIIDSLKRQGNYTAVWHKAFGNGYMCISYPQYNPNTNILQMEQWEENQSSCGTGRQTILTYKKVPNGWQAY